MENKEMNMQPLAPLLLVAVLFASSVSLAGHHGHHKDMDKHLEKMAKHLDLSDEQKAQIKLIHEEMKECRKAHREKVDAILTEEQREKHKRYHQTKGDKQKTKNQES
jgi:Spy/CpxP family protein refolding chaperone